MSWIRRLQAEHREWLASRYAGQDPKLPLMGLIGEVGEACHAALSEYKEQQHGLNPRHVGHNAALLDALGDCVVYAISWCNAVDWDAAAFDWETGTGITAVHPLDLMYPLAAGAAYCYAQGGVTQAFVDYVVELCRLRGSDVHSVAEAAWAQVKGRVR